MASTSSTPTLSPSEGYRHWARKYDAEPNPMLALERRYLEPLLPRVAGLDVVDLGCGTGRWLENLKEGEPRSLLGVDPSREMLRQATKKLGSAARFVRADGGAAPLAEASADLVLGNFVLSYAEDAAGFLANARLTLRETGSLFLTDVHPETRAALRWRRGVRRETEFQEIRTQERSIDMVIALCESVGFRLRARLEPCFGEAERMLFQEAGKTNYYEQAAGYPAIYILQLQPATRHGAIAFAPVENTISAIENGHIAVGPRESIRGNVRIANSRIAALGSGINDGASIRDANSTIDLQGFLLLPGLVNAHDHLEFALFPRLGKGDYLNCVDWAEDIHRSEASIIAKHRQVPREVRLWWGGIRNLLCGVTTVAHHNPYDGGVFDRDFVVRVVREYGWAHSLSMDTEAVRKKQETPKGQPFLIHLAEGIDERSGREIGELQRAGGLDKETVLIHGLGLNQRGRALLRATGAGLIWCPSSNVFLFGRTLSGRVLESLENVAIGSDSPLTAVGDLLDEVRFAWGVSQLAVEKLYEFVSRQAAKLLRLRDGQGSIRVGGMADLVAVCDRGESPADTLAVLSYREIELVLLAGRVHLVSEEMLQRLPEAMRQELRQRLQPLWVEGTLRWVRGPLDWLFGETVRYLPDGIFLGGKRVSLGRDY